ncbi:hypothetical protein L2E82_30772 [Cichorium intybus]|uniref:Uncharacterized protein n=1 Tax=Cichorium intybus TaxID=13427 RepID=A0ACB9D1B3_CICIN|nr:hypothetical protein L2E82_30772 [Cichorium intybus]
MKLLFTLFTTIALRKTAFIRKLYLQFFLQLGFHKNNHSKRLHLQSHLAPHLFLSRGQEDEKDFPSSNDLDLFEEDVKKLVKSSLEGYVIRSSLARKETRNIFIQNDKRDTGKLVILKNLTSELFSLMMQGCLQVGYTKFNAEMGIQLLFEQNSGSLRLASPGATAAAIQNHPPSLVGDPSNLDSMGLLASNKGRPKEAIVEQTDTTFHVELALLLSNTTLNCRKEFRVVIEERDMTGGKVKRQGIKKGTEVGYDFVTFRTKDPASIHLRCKELRHNVFAYFFMCRCVHVVTLIFCF